MDYKLFDEYITLQALLKELGIIQSGGAIKSYLAEHEVYFNGDRETRRGKKIRFGDTVTIPEKNIQINILEPNTEEIQIFKDDQIEKERIAKLVKEMNKNIKKPSKTKKTSNKQKKAEGFTRKNEPVRFPGT